VSRKRSLQRREHTRRKNTREDAGRSLFSLVTLLRDDFDLSILTIEHHMQFVMGICDRIYVLDYGKLIAEGVPSEIQKNPKIKLRIFSGYQATFRNCDLTCYNHIFQ